MTPVIKAFQLGKIYGNVTALEQLNLELNPGEIFGLLGQNGAGKTTTIKLALGLIRPTSGSIQVFGRQPGDPATYRKIGYLPEVLNIHDFLTPEEYLRFHGRLCQIEKSKLERKIDELLQLVGMDEQRRLRISTFSKGMLQRIGFAQALINEPELLILDEPTSGLDPIGRREMRDIFITLKQRGMTIILNSHVLLEIEKACDRVGILKKGRLIDVADTSALAGGGQNIVAIQVRQITDSLIPVLNGVCTDIKRKELNLILTLKEGVDVAQIPDLVKTAGAELVGLMPQQETLEDRFFRLVKPEGAGVGMGREEGL